MWVRLAQSSLSRLSHDRLWWLALAAGPAFWLFLASSGTAIGELRWPLVQPLSYLRLAVVIPVLEELVFRGALQGWLLQQAWGVRQRVGLSNANLVTSLVFTAAHIVSHPPLWALSVLLPSLVFGYFRERHAGLLAPILLHASYNAGYFWLFYTPAA